MKNFIQKKVSRWHFRKYSSCSEVVCSVLNQNRLVIPPSLTATITLTFWVRLIITLSDRLFQYQFILKCCSPSSRYKGAIKYTMLRPWRSGMANLPILKKKFIELNFDEEIRIPFTYSTVLHFKEICRCKLGGRGGRSECQASNVCQCQSLLQRLRRSRNWTIAR